MSTPCSTWRRLILLLLTGWLCAPPLWINSLPS